MRSDYYYFFGLLGEQEGGYFHSAFSMTAVLCRFFENLIGYMYAMAMPRISYCRLSNFPLMKFLLDFYQKELISEVGQTHPDVL